MNTQVLSDEVLLEQNYVNVARQIPEAGATVLSAFPEARIAHILSTNVLTTQKRRPFLDQYSTCHYSHSSSRYAVTAESSPQRLQTLSGAR